MVISLKEKQVFFQTASFATLPPEGRQFRQAGTARNIVHDKKEWL